jgi:hypothetical protein
MRREVPAWRDDDLTVDRSPIAAYNPDLNYIFLASDHWTMSLKAWKAGDTKYKAGDVYMAVDYQMARLDDTIGNIKACELAKRQFVWFEVSHRVKGDVPTRTAIFGEAASPRIELIAAVLRWKPAGHVRRMTAAPAEAPVRWGSTSIARSGLPPQACPVSDAGHRTDAGRAAEIPYAPVARRSAPPGITSPSGSARCGGSGAGGGAMAVSGSPKTCGCACGEMGKAA